MGSLSETTRTLLTAALDHQRAGRAIEAEHDYRQVLQQQPDWVDALNLFGAWLYQQVRFAEALECFERVRSLQPESADALNSMGVVLKALGRSPEAVAYYHQALALQPNHPEVYSNLGNALRDTGDLSGAIAAYRQALNLKPSHAEAHNNLGVALKDLGKLDEAIAHYRQAIQLKPNYPDAHHNLASALHRLEQFTDAETYFRQAIALKPNYPEAQHGLGTALQRLNRLEEAISYHQQAIALRPDYPEAHHGVANVLQQQGQLDAAIAAYRQALDLRPDYAEVCNNLGNALQAQGQLEAAIAHYQKALALRPTMPEAHSNLGSALRDQGQHDEAIAHFQQALALKPDYAEVYNNLGNAYYAQGKLEAAIATYQRSLQLQPNVAEVHSNLGNMLQCVGEFDTAFGHFQRAIDLQPDYVGAYNNLGIALRNCGRLAEATTAYNRALKLEPNCIEARWNFALIQLLLGDFEAGFAGYEWRLQWDKFQQQHPPRPYHQPYWDGSSLTGKTLLIYTEQGCGDAIQFSRYIPLLAARGATIVVECPPQMMRLLQGVAGITQLLPQGSPLPDFDLHVSLMSLPHLLGTTIATVPAVVPYLAVPGRQLPQGKTGDRRQATGDVIPDLKVGIVWTGNSKNPYNRARAVPLAQLLRLAELPNLQLYSLQKDLSPADLDLLQAHPEVIDLQQWLDDFVDTAALIQQLDLVISVDTAVTHLAGALGQPVWLLLPFAPDWRWLLERTDSPWYPTLRIFRQAALQDWDSVIEAVQHELAKFGNLPTTSADIKASNRPQAQPSPPVSQFPVVLPALPQQVAAIAPAPSTPNKPKVPSELHAAVKLYNAGQYIEAERLCQQALAQQEVLECWHLLGLIAHQQQQFAAAIAHYNKALTFDPNQYETYNNLAVAFQQQGNLDQAIAHYEKALALKPDYADAHNNFANALRDKNRLDEALAHYEQAIAYRPNYPDAHNNLGLVYYTQGDYTKAAAAYRQAIALKPDYHQALNHLGNALKELGDFEQAAHYYERAVALKPDYAKAINNWGNVFRDSGDLTTALQYYDRATELDASFAEAHWNKALTYLLAGDLQRGFAEYEWRWQVKLPTFQAQRQLAKPLWDGTPLDGKTLFLHAEQGMGDVLQFFRYVAIAKSLGGRIILECHLPLMNLLRHQPDVLEIIPYGSTPADFDLHAPLLSLPHILGTTVETVPATVPYLVVPMGEQRLPGEERGERGEGRGEAYLKVGMVWTGNPKNPYNRARAVPLEQLLTLAALPNVQLYSLQKERSPADEALLRSHPKVIDLHARMTDFVDTAALIQQLDLVISVDTAVTHLAGALGKSVWLLLPFAPDWRWMLERADSPWYPTLQIFRQAAAGEWQPVIEQVQASLRGGRVEGKTEDRRQKIEGRKQKAGSRNRDLGTATTGFGVGQPAHQKVRQSQAKANSITSLSTAAAVVAPIAPTPHLLLRQAHQQFHSGNFAEAERLCRQILTEQPADVATLHMLGVILCQSKQMESAIAYFRRALELRPDFAEAWGNLAGALQEQGQSAEAIAGYQKALALQPTFPEAHQNLAIVLRELGRLDEAIAHSRQALALKADSPEIYYNLGFMLRQIGDLDGAIAHYQTAIKLKPDFVSAHKNLGHAFLLKGNFRDGFAKNEWRWQQENWSRRSFTQPEWDGSALTGKTILLYAEQGFGDTIQFIRFASLVKVKGGRVIVECQAPLLKLLEGVTGVDQLMPQDSPMPEFDVQLPLMSVPHAIGLTLEMLPGQMPYLGGDRRAGRKERGEKKFRVGIVWWGNPSHKNNHLRSCQLSDFQPLFDLPGVEFLSLQKGEAEQDLQQHSEFPVVDLSSQLQDFADTAAIIQSLDLVITVDTAVAHLAGALGKPVWVLLHYAPDWRWLLERTDSPWYPTMRLFRQAAWGDWAGVFEQVQSALAQVVVAGLPNQVLDDAIAPISNLPSATAVIGMQPSLTSDWGVLGLQLALQLRQNLACQPLLRSPLEPTLPALWRSRLSDLPLLHLPDQELEQFSQVVMFHRLADLPTTQVRGNCNIGFVTDLADLEAEVITQAQTCDRIIVPATWVAERLQQQGLMQVQVMPWGVDQSLFHPAPKLNLWGDRFVIFSGDPFSYQNGQDLLIQAFQIFQRHHADALLVTAWNHAAAGAIAELPPEAVCQLGAVPYLQLAQVLRESDVAVFASRCSVTNALATASLACGIPTVLSANTSQRDLTRQNLGYPLLEQQSVSRDLAGIDTTDWGESQVEELLETLERIYTNQTEALHRGRIAADFLQDWSWENQMQPLLNWLNFS